MKSNQLYKIIKCRFGIIIISISYWFYKLREYGTIGKFVSYLYCKFLECFGITCCNIVDTTMYISEKTLDSKKLIESRIGIVSGMSILGQEYDSSRKELPLKDINLTLFKDIYIAGDSDVLYDGHCHCVVNDYCYDIDSNRVIVDGWLYKHKGNVCLLRKKIKGNECVIDSGIMINGKLSYNYYHELYENLCRLILLDFAVIPEDVPILVDETVSKIRAFSSILECLNRQHKRDVIFLKKNEIYYVRNLYRFDHINYICSHLLNVSHPDDSMIYDETLMLKFRDSLLHCKSRIETPKRIFLTRRNSKVRHCNESEIMRELEQFGFESVAPEKFSFEEQITLFNNAEIIIGGSGAAFSNCIFCSPDCSLILFTPHKIPIFNTIAYISGAKLYYYKPETVSQRSLHSDYSISVNDLKESILPLISNKE